MNVLRAKTAGFCMGVALALQKLDKAWDEKDQNPQPRGQILTLGPIIHNPQVLENYAAKGVGRIANPEEAQPGDCVLIRAHGIPREAEEALRARQTFVVDATCPKVKKAQLAIADATGKGRCLLLFGEADHPEVRGLVSYATAGAHVFESLEQLQTMDLPGTTSYVLASQTTQDRKVFDNIEASLRQRFADLPVLSTICDATRRRQDEILDIASRVDAVVVVGGKDSGNTRRLVDVAAAQGVPTWHVETVSELEKKNFAPNMTVGLTAGASTPKSLIDAVQEFLEMI